MLRGSKLVKVLRHLLDLSVEMLLYFFNESGITGKYEVNCSSFSSKSTCSTDSVNVVFLFERKLVVDNETYLLDVNSSCEQVSGDEYSGGSSSELFHDHVSLDLVHFSVHG